MILFICLWNSERSVIAEELYNKYTNSSTAKSVWMKITKSPRNKYIYKLLNKEWIDISKKKKKKFKKSKFLKASKVYVLCDKKYCPKYLINSNKTIFWDISDPWWRKKWFLFKTKEKIEKHLLEIIKK